MNNELKEQILDLLDDIDTEAGYIDNGLWNEFQDSKEAVNSARGSASDIKQAVEAIKELLEE